jgi:hypothetical protein
LFWGRRRRRRRRRKGVDLDILAFVLSGSCTTSHFASELGGSYQPTGFKEIV